jgi:hypothetical protein
MAPFVLLARLTPQPWPVTVTAKMGKLYNEVSHELRDWLSQQQVFFVASAPLAASGHINCSPKGGDTFRVIGPCEVAYLDLTGSGIETAAHVQENGRIVIMFCAFSGSPKIVRLHGRGEAVFPAHPDFSGLCRQFPIHRGIRAVIRIRLTRISDSCGYGVPLMEFTGQRTVLDQQYEQKGAKGLVEYQQAKNRRSIDHLPGINEA